MANEKDSIDMFLADRRVSEPTGRSRSSLGQSRNVRPPSRRSLSVLGRITGQSEDYLQEVLLASPSLARELEATKREARRRFPKPKAQPKPGSRHSHVQEEHKGPYNVCPSCHRVKEPEVFSGIARKKDGKLDLMKDERWIETVKDQALRGWGKEENIMEKPLRSLTSKVQARTTNFMEGRMVSEAREQYTDWNELKLRCDGPLDRSFFRIRDEGTEYMNEAAKLGPWLNSRFQTSS